MKMLKEFKEFVMRGNVMDLAVGVIIGGAFGAIVTSLTDDIISPILGIFGGMDFSDLAVNVNGANIAYGKFITAIINFLIMALIIFLLVKAVNKLMSLGKKKEEETTLTPPAETESTTVETVPEPEPEPEVKEPQTIEIIDTMPESPNALESEEEMIIEVPEGSELGGD